MKREIAKNIDEYISGFPEHTREKLEQIRSLIKKAVPEAEEKISYGIAAFRLNNAYLVYFAGFKNHVSIYPAPYADEAFEKRVAAYRGGKGTIQFQLDKPLPLKLIDEILKIRIRINREKAEKKGKRS